MPSRLMRALILRIAVASFSVASRAPAQTTSVPAPVVAIEPAVETVVSGGRWKSADAQGRYRLVVVAEGWEEVRHRAFVQWVRESPSPNAPEAVRESLDLTLLAHAFGLAHPALATRSGRWFLTLRGADRPTSDYSRRLTFELGPPGHVRRIDSR